MKIEQAFIGNKNFIKPFLTKYGLASYRSDNEPVVFFGLYPMKHLNYVISHKTTVVIIWAGSDILQLNEHNVEHFRSPNIHHIAISSFIADDLKRWNLKYINLPVTPHDYSMFAHCPLGPDLYTYTFTPKQCKERSQTYGYNLIEQIQARLPHIKIHMYNCKTLGRDNIINIYKQCFMGLRFTKHDGLSNTVVELGLMGRKVLWNGTCPNSINYTTIDDIVSKIEAEQHRIKQRMYTSTNVSAISAEMQKFITLPANWLTTEFYQ